MHDPAAERRRPLPLAAVGFATGIALGLASWPTPRAGGGGFAPFADRALFATLVLGAVGFALHVGAARNAWARRWTHWFGWIGWTRWLGSIVTGRSDRAAGDPRALRGSRGSAFVFVAFAAWGVLRVSSLAAPYAPTIRVADAAADEATRATHEPEPARLVAPEPARLVAIEGRVSSGLLDLPKELAIDAPPSAAIELTDARVDFGSGYRPSGGRVRVELPAADRFVPRGVRVAVLCRLREPRTARNPGEIGEAERLRLSGIAWIGVAATSAALRVTPGSPFDPRPWLDRARRAIVFGFARALSPESAGLAAALLLGVRDGLDPDFVSALAGSGTIHLLAISGMQVAWLVFVIRGFLGLALRPAAADVAALLFALLYSDLAGAETPVMRAAIAAVLARIGALAGHPSRPLDALALAALVLLAAEPGELLRPGFQLSFLACFALLSEPPREPEPASASRAGTIRRALEAVAVGARLSLRATLLTAPAVAAHFGTFAPLGPLLTLLLTPLFVVAFAFVAAFAPLAVIAAATPFPSDRWLTIAGAPVEFALVVLRWAFREGAALPGATLYLCAPCAAAALLFTLAADRVLVQPRRLRAAIGLVLVALTLEIARCAPPCETELIVLDVGHGQAALVRRRDGTNLLVDCGARGRDRHAGERVARLVRRACAALGVRRIDLAILTHGDADHVNGLPGLIERGMVRAIVHGPSFEGSIAKRVRAVAHEYAVPVVNAAGGDRIRAEGGVLVITRDRARADPSAWIRILHPAEERGDDRGDDLEHGRIARDLRSEPGALADLGENDSSLVASISIDEATSPTNPTSSTGWGRSILMPGDVETPGIVRLLAAAPDLRAEVVLLPHHGHDEAGLTPLLFTTRSRLWIASRGTYRSGSLAERLAERFGARLLVTVDHGAIRVRFRTDGSSRIETFVGD